MKRKTPKLVRKTLWLVAVLALMITSAPVAASQGNRVNYSGQGFDRAGGLESEKCDPADLGLDKGFKVSEDGSYLKWVLTATGASSATLHGPWGEYDMLQAGKGAFQKATAYYDLKDLSGVYATWEGTTRGRVQLVVSNGCSGTGFEELKVTKTAFTSFDRKHKWSIDKKVTTGEGYTSEQGTPKIWLSAEGSADGVQEDTATWTVSVKHQGYWDSSHKVSGDITIKNTGTLDATITTIKDHLVEYGVYPAVTCPGSLPYELAPGDQLTCSYSRYVDEKVDGKNVVTVDTERASYTGNASVAWGDPTNEKYKTVNVKDVMTIDGAPPVWEKSWIVTANKDLSYSKKFKFDLSMCRDKYYQYENTASIIETGQKAKAELVVFIQCPNPPTDNT